MNLERNFCIIFSWTILFFLEVISPDVKHPNKREVQSSSDFSFYYNRKCQQHSLSKNVAKVKQFHQFPLLVSKILEDTPSYISYRNGQKWKFGLSNRKYSHF